MKKILMIVGAASLVAVTVVSCRKSAATCREEVVDGIPVVRNFAPSQPERGARLKFVVDLVFPADPAVEPLGNAPGEMRVDAKGRMFVLDRGDMRVRVFSSDGKLIRDMGRPGQGPGDLEYPLGMEIEDDGSLLVLELLHIDVFEPDGRFREVRPHPDMIMAFSRLPAGGFLLSRRTVSAEAGGEDRHAADVRIASSDFRAIRTIFERPQLRTARISDGTFTFELPLFIRWAVGRDGTIVVGSADEYALEVRAGDGTLRRRFAREVPRVPVAGVLRTKIEGVLNRLGVGNPEIERVLFLPFFTGLSIDERGRTWVRRLVTTGAEEPARSTPFDVFDAKGVFLFTVEIPGNLFPDPLFRNGFAYALRQDLEGEIQAVRFRVVED